MQALWEAEEYEHYLERTEEQVIKIKFEMLMVPTVLTPFKGVTLAVT